MDARDVLVTNPAVADAVAAFATPQSIVMGVGPGDTDAVFFDAAGRRMSSLNISVGAGRLGACRTPWRACRALLGARRVEAAIRAPLS